MIVASTIVPLEARAPEQCQQITASRVNRTAPLPRQVQKVEQLLQAVNSWHPLQTERPPASLAPRIKRLRQPALHSSDHGTTRSISTKNAARLVVFALRSNLAAENVVCFNVTLTGA